MNQTCGKTWFFDIDGTIVPNLSYDDLVKHEKEQTYTQDLLPGAKNFFATLNDLDVVIFTTARPEEYREMTKRTLEKHGIKYRLLIMGLPSGERYLINDTVNCVYQKAIAINVLRDVGFGDTFIFDPEH